MSKIDPLITITTGFNSTAQLNSNFNDIEAAFNNTLSRDGSTPNQMDAVLDMNSNRIINLLDPVNNQDAVTKIFFETNPPVAADIAAAEAAAEAAALSETNTAISETNTAISETNAATSAASALLSAGAASAVAINWIFDSSTSMSDPGTADIRLNNATISSVTSIAVSSLTNETGNPDISDFIITWDDSTTLTNRGTFILKKATDSTFFAVFNVSGAITDNGTWLEIPVTHIDSSGVLTDTDSLFTQFIRTGDKGLTGGGTGDMLAANNLSDVVSAASSLSNIGGVGPATSNTFTNKTVDANGTGNVYTNFDIGNMIAASQAEAEAGTNNTKLLTSLRVKQAITAQAGVGTNWTYVNGTVAGDNIEFPGIPAGIKEIEMFATDLRHNTSTVGVEIQIGDSGGMETSGYHSINRDFTVGDVFTSLESSTGFTVNKSPQNAITYSFMARLAKSRDDDDAWHCTSSGMADPTGGDASYTGFGRKTLSAELTQMRLHKTNSTGSFDAGTVYIRHR